MTTAEVLPAAMSAGGMTLTRAAPPSGAPSFLRLEHLTKSFGSGATKTVVVDNVALDVAPSEFVCILGPSGCGKTTLLRLIAGFETADSGQIRQAERDITRLPPEARDFGIVFQSYALFPNQTVAQNVAYGLLATGVTRAAREARVADLLKLVGLQDHAGKYPSQISGGQQQRVALARSLALSPSLLLLDEPLSALDANVRTTLRDELRALQRRLGVTTLMVTHDQHEALSIADRLVLMNHGRIEQVGTPSEVYDKPASLFAARFLGPLNALPVDAVAHNEIRVGSLTLRRDSASPPTVGRTQACIRPAAILIGPEAIGAINAMTVTVEDTVFLGDLMRVTVILPGDGPRRLNVDAYRARLETEPRPGESIAIALPPRHIMVLDDDSSRVERSS